MSYKNCRKCGESLPPQVRPGRPRERCEKCAPVRRTRPPSTQLPPAEPVETRVVRVDGKRVIDVSSHVDVAAELGPRALALYDEYGEAVAGLPLHRVLLDEVCRMADRLDRMQSILKGDRQAWLHFLHDALESVGDDWPDDVPEVKVNISAIAVEARQTAIAIKQLVGEIRQATGKKQAGAGQDGTGAPADPIAALQADVDQLAERRNRRGAS